MHLPPFFRKKGYTYMRVESRPIFKKQRRQYRIKEFQSCGDDAWCDYHPPYLRF